MAEVEFVLLFALSLGLSAGSVWYAAREAVPAIAALRALHAAPPATRELRWRIAELAPPDDSDRVVRLRDRRPARARWIAAPELRAA